MPIKRKISTRLVAYFLFRFGFAFLLFFLCPSLHAQTAVNAQNDTTSTAKLTKEEDVMDIARKVFKIKVDTTKPATPPRFALLPSIGYNPSLGFLIGAKISAVKNYGTPETTNLSTLGLEGVITTKGIITGQVRSNFFTNKNKWNFQGNQQLSKFVLNDYGIGTGNKEYLTNSDSAFEIKFSFIRISEKAYRRIGPHFYIGAGISFDIRQHIKDEKLEELGSSPHYRYSVRNDFDTSRYKANGFIIAIQYNTKEHPLRSYGGVYWDIGLRFNETWLGSDKASTQLIYDFRKYWSLSKKNPEHVLAFWHWASYKLSGSVPYLELPATAYDTYARSGRAYTIGRFKGPSYACFEGEYRFPILRNKFISGVAFLNAQTASDDVGKKVFEYWEAGEGFGVRILFQKQSRSTMCIDYAVGNYDSRGLFFGLNEVF